MSHPARAEGLGKYDTMCAVNILKSKRFISVNVSLETKILATLNILGVLKGNGLTDYYC